MEKTITTLNFFALTLVVIIGQANHLRAQDAGLAALDARETFEKLCVDEFKAKREHDNYVGLESEDELYDRYQEVRDSRIVLGTKLGLHFCPPELDENDSTGNGPQCAPALFEKFRQHLLERIELAYETKCRAEMRTAVLCHKLTEARQVSSDETLALELKRQEEAACQHHQRAQDARKKYAEKHSIAKPCGVSLSREARQSAEREANELLLSEAIELASHPGAGQKHNKAKHSFKSKVCTFLGSCLRKSRRA